MIPLYTDPSIERITITSLIAVTLHLFILYGIGFSIPKAAEPMNSTMDIILVQKRTEKPPKDANFLAQASQEGGGETEQDVHPVTPTIAPFPDQVANIAATSPLPQMAAAPEPPDVELLTAPDSTQSTVVSHVPVPFPEESTEVGGEDLETTVEDSIPTNTLIMDIQAKVASLQAELDEKLENLAKRPRHEFLTASTKEYKYATYMDSWRIQVEHVGTLNFPDAARRKKLSGSLMLDVAINANGTIHDVVIVKSSGHKILDDAALRIVHLAAPFDVFPENIRRNIEVLHITRTWNFTYGLTLGGP